MTVYACMYNRQWLMDIAWATKARSVICTNSVIVAECHLMLTILPACSQLLEQELSLPAARADEA